MQRTKKRINILFYGFLIIFLILAGMLVWRQAFPDPRLEEAFASQQLEVIKTVYNRGVFVDRDGRALTGGRIEEEGIAYGDCVTSELLDKVIGEVRVDEDVTTDEATQGISGLQAVYDDILSYRQFPYFIFGVTDAAGNVLKGESVYVKSIPSVERPVITLTVNANVQRVVEEALADFCVRYPCENIAVVLSDVETGEVLAMHSVGSYLNTAVISYQPGSVFKLIPLGCALENGLISQNTTFDCNGTVTLDGKEKVVCKDGGHGRQSLEEAVADSCNCAFYEIMRLCNKYDDDGNITGNLVLEKMRKLGIGTHTEPVLNDFVLNYDYAYDFVSDNLFNETATFNAALGEGDIQLMPITVNSIVASFANGGKVIEPVIVDNVWRPGEQVEEMADVEMRTAELFNPRVCEIVLSCMRAVCTDGTASLSENVRREVAGKTGTAEHVDGREDHAWFAGVFPYDSPQYAMTVMIDEGGSSVNAVQVFDEILARIKPML